MYSIALLESFEVIPDFRLSILRAKGIDDHVGQYPIVLVGNKVPPTHSPSPRRPFVLCRVSLRSFIEWGGGFSIDVLGDGDGGGGGGGAQADQETERQVKTTEGEELARKWNSSFYETSARTGHNIHEVFAGARRLNPSHPFGAYDTRARHTHTEASRVPTHMGTRIQT